MGSQVNFYLVPDDEEEFLSFVRSDPNAAILYATRLDTPLVLASSPLPTADRPYCWRLAIWNRLIATESEIRPPGKVPCDGSPDGRYDIPAMVYPVVEVLRSSLGLRGVTPGRIWADLDHFKLGTEQRKLFRAWFRRLASWLNHLPYRCDMYRIGPKTKELL